MNILLDMNIPDVWEGFLCDAGHSAIHWSRVGNIRAMDNEIMKWARENNHVVFTHDLDFDSVDRRRLRHALPGFCRQDAGGPRADPLQAVCRHSLRSKLECVAVSIHVSNPAPFRTRISEQGTRSVKKLRARNAVSTIPSSEFRVPRHAMDDNQATHQTSKATTMSFAQEIYQKSLSLPPEDGRAIVDELQGAARLLPQARGRFLIIVDTGFWFGLLDRRDRYHESCRRFSCADSAANLAG